MKTATKGVFALFASVLPVVLPLTAAPVPKVKPEEVGMSSERLQRIEQMLERRIAAGEMTGAVAIVARKGKIVYLTAKGVDGSGNQAARHSGHDVPRCFHDEAGHQRRAHDDGRRRQGATERSGLALYPRVQEPEGRGGGSGPGARRSPGSCGEAARGGRGGRGGAPPNFTTVAAEREVTIKDLLTHVSGLASGTMSNSTVQAVARKQGEKLADYIPRLGNTALEFQPGSRWAYSAQAGHDTLGRIVEIASGMPLNEFFQKRIFDPLGMKDITFWPSEAQWPRVAERLQPQAPTVSPRTTIPTACRATCTSWAPAG